MRLTLFVTFFIVVFAGIGRADDACATAHHNDLDFWLGEWDVSNAAGAPSGKSRVEKILSGCVVMENWSSVRGGYEGKSFNTFDGATGSWSQHWVDNNGMSASMSGEFHDKDLVYRREFKDSSGKPVMSRMTLFNRGADGVRQLVEQSRDGGKTWSKQFDLRYVRRK